MAKVLVGVKEFTRNAVVVLDGDGEEIDRMIVNWKTPTDDEALDIQQARYTVLKQLDDVRSGTGGRSAEELFGMIRQAKADSAELIERYFESVIDADDCLPEERYEVGDLQRMLQNKRYAGALLKSLNEVAAGDVALGNSSKPDTSGKQVDSPDQVESVESVSSESPSLNDC